jgi:hypothetical protein
MKGSSRSDTVTTTNQFNQDDPDSGVRVSALAEDQLCRAMAHLGAELN